MIYTLTFNPSLDYILQVNNFQEGTINKTTYEKILPGGKGINVSIVLSNLGFPNTALGFVAGFTGKEIEDRLKKYKCTTDFIHVDGISRINIKMKSNSETEINGQGPKIQEKAIQKLFEKLDQLKKEDILIISGSIPKTLPENMYEQIMKHLQGKGILIVIDAVKDLLKNALKYKPFLIKPNHHELAELFETNIDSKTKAIQYARKLKKLGAQNVLVSMAEQGAILIDAQDKEHTAQAYPGTVINSVGAGDSMVAGFLAGYLETKDYKYALHKGIAAGCASTFSEDLATKEAINRYLNDQ